MFDRALFVVPLLSFASLLAGQEPQPFRFVAIGDTGSGSKEQQRVADQMGNWMQQHAFHLVLMLGDNIYGSHEFSGGGDPRFFHDKFDLQYEKFQQQGVVFHAVIGNHDMQTDRARGEIEDQKRFGILGPEGYYEFSSADSFNVKGRPLVDFFALNAELENQEMARQVDWLRTELQKSKAIWKVVFLHDPLYSVSGRHAPARALRGQIEESLKEYHVQFIISGHNHFYARLKPLNETIQLISGGGGRNLYVAGLDKCAEISARKYHFVGVEVYPDKVNVTAIDENGQVFDQKSVDEDYLKTSTAGCPAR